MSVILIVLVFLLVLTNTALGLFVAIELGYGPPTFVIAVRQLGLSQPGQLVQGLVEPVYYFFYSLIARLTRKREAVVVEDEPLEEPEIEEPSRNIDVEAMLKSVSEANVSDLLDDESEEIEMVVPLKELFDEDLVSALMDKGTEAWLMGEKHVETSILKLNVVMMKSGVFSANLDNRLRSTKDATADQVKGFMQELRDDCTNYLTSQAEITAQIQKRVDEFGELSHLAEDIDYANMEQAAQIETTISNIDSMKPADNPGETLQKLIKELSKLRVARHRLRDQQEKAFLTVVRYENRLGTVSPQLYLDETVGVRGRIGLEATLADWWKQKRQHSRQICMALLDFVHFSETNDENGIMICDKVLRFIGKKLDSAFTSQDLTGVFSGNCFFIVTTNQGLRKTISDVEKIRQTVARQHFHYNKSEKQFTVGMTGVVVEAVPAKTDHELLQSAEKMLLQSKKKGRNRLYMVDQSSLTTEPELVESPSLAIEHVIVDLDNVR